MAARLRRDGVTMVWGGLHASLNPAECAEAAGIVCRGEGEETILEFVQKLEEGRDWRDVRNLAYQRNGSVILNPMRPPLASLDDLPESFYGLRVLARCAVENAEPVEQRGAVGGIGG